MDWFKVARAYWPAIVAVVFSFLAMGALAPLRDSQMTAGIFATFRWLPVGGMAFGLFYAGWVTYRLAQAEQGKGYVCPRCGGPLGQEQDGRYGEYRRCLTCGHNVSRRYYS